MSVNIHDSILFLLTLRNTLSEFISSESNLNLVDKAMAKNYIMNEASDYEIMSLLMTGEFPSSKYDLVKEEKLFNQFRNYVHVNEEKIQKYFKINLDIVNEIESISKYNLSSAVPILEFLLHEQDDDEAGSKIGKLANAGMTAAMMRPQGGYVNYAKTIPGKVKSIPGKVKAAPGQIRASMANAPAKLGGLFNRGRQAATNGMSSVVSFAKSGPGKILGVVAIAALVALAASIVYKKKFDQASKSCANYHGPEKQNCVRGFKRSAIQAQIAQLKAGMTACAGTKNPVKCQANITKKIQSLMNKLNKI
jgi:hypothetical protein